MSNINLDIPLVRTTRESETMPSIDGLQVQDMAQAVGVKLPPIDKNFANDQKVKDYCKNVLYGLVDWIRNDRQTLEEEWRAILRMEWMVHDAGQRYVGPTNSYLPVFGRIHNTLVSSLSRGMFPSDEYMDVIDRAKGASDQAKATKTYLQWEFERVGQVRRKIKPFLRSFSSFGNAVLKYWYDKEPRLEGRAGRAGNNGMMDMEPHFSTYHYCEGLRVSPRNIFHWYIWPYTADGVDEATLIFEDIAVPRFVIEERIKSNQYANADEAMKAPEPSAHATTESTRMSSLLGLSPTQGSPTQSNDLGEMRVLTECWTYMVLPDAAYMEHETKGMPLAVKVVMAGSTPVEVRRNPFFHQRPPYLFARMNAQAALVYGYGHGRLVRPLQYLINDFANQTADVGQFSMNPITIMNPSYMAGPMAPLSPGVVWYMSDVNEGVRFEKPDWELVRGGQEMVNMLTSMAQDLGGTPPVMQGTKGDKTATTTQILQNNAMQPLQDTVEDLELDVLVPLMRGAWMNAQQYRDKAIMAMIGNMTMPIQISPEQLILDPEFRWMASSQAINQAQRAQSMLQFMQAGMAAQPALNMQGLIFNPKPLLERTLVDGMGTRLPEDLFIPIGMPAAPGMPPSPAVMTAQDNAIRSSADQANGRPYEMQGEMAPGEGEAFAEVRNGSEDLSAQMGGNNGKMGA